MKQTIRKRRVKLIIAVIVMLFAGIIYAWSITKTPFMQLSGDNVVNATQLGLNYTITIIFFCIGGFIAGLISKQSSTGFRFVLSAMMLFTCFYTVSLQTVTIHHTENYFMLYMAYGVLGGLGIGVAYVTVISTINMWYPEKRGFASGIMLMSFGLSLLVIGSIVDILGKSEAVGWRTTYVIIAISLGAVFLIAAIFIRPPTKNTVFPEPKAPDEASSNNKTLPGSEAPAGGEAPQQPVLQKNYTAIEMINRSSFYLIFVYIAILASSGSAAISFAKDIIIDVGATERFSVIAVGMLGVSNGLGRLISGWLFDKFGIKHTQFISSAAAIMAPLTVVTAIAVNSLILGVLGLCLCGFSYGFAPTTSSIFASKFYGPRNFPLNFSILNLILIPAPFAAMLAGGIKSSTGGFMTAFLILTGLTVIGFFINLLIKRP